MSSPQPRLRRTEGRRPDEVLRRTLPPTPAISKSEVPRGVGPLWCFVVSRHPWRRHGTWDWWCCRQKGHVGDVNFAIYIYTIISKTVIGKELEGYRQRGLGMWPTNRSQLSIRMSLKASNTPFSLGAQDSAGIPQF